MASDRTEKPTPRRRQKAREQGQVTRSRELTSSAALMASLMALAWAATSTATVWRGLYRGLLGSAATGEIDLSLLTRSCWLIVQTAGPVAALAFLVAGVTAVAQGGLVVVPSALAVKIERLSPGSKLKRLFSLTAVANLGKSLLPAAVLTYLTVAILTRDWHSLTGLERLSSAPLLNFLLGRAFELAWKSTLVLLAWAGLDYFVERHRLEQDLRMSRQEVLEEFKESEGHPAIKARIRRLQRQLRRRRILSDVERAAVVITNPTEYAVALEYRATMSAPVVLAKGRNILAREIRQIALWHGIPLIENRPLAHALYRAVEIGQSIPPKLYAVVAEVLALVWRAQARASEAAAARGAS